MQFIGVETPQTNAWTSSTALTNTADTLTGSIFSDQAGTLHVEQSGNGTNWDVDDSISVSASTTAKINVVLLNPYLRLRWASSSNPTVFRVYARAASASVKA